MMRRTDINNASFSSNSSLNTIATIYQLMLKSLDSTILIIHVYFSATRELFHKVQLLQEYRPLIQTDTIEIDK